MPVSDTSARAEAAPERRARRHDPDRKDRIIDVTLDVVAEHGVAGTTHRLVAAAADVPLGSLTYYFTGMDDLLEQAFLRHAERMSVVYAGHFDDVHDRAQLVESITDLIHSATSITGRDAVVSFELYLAALRQPALRTITETWMASSRTVLHRFLDDVTAHGVDALIEGLMIQSILSTQPMPRAHTVAYVTRALGPAPLRSDDQGTT